MSNIRRVRRNPTSYLPSSAQITLGADTEGYAIRRVPRAARINIGPNANPTLAQRVSLLEDDVAEIGVALNEQLGELTNHEERIGSLETMAGAPPSMPNANLGMGFTPMSGGMPFSQGLNRPGMGMGAGAMDPNYLQFLQQKLASGTLDPSEYQALAASGLMQGAGGMGGINQLAAMNGGIAPGLINPMAFGGGCGPFSGGFGGCGPFGGGFGPCGPFGGPFGPCGGPCGPFGPFGCGPCGPFGGPCGPCGGGPCGGMCGGGPGCGGPGGPGGCRKCEAGGKPCKKHRNQQGSQSQDRQQMRQQDRQAASDLDSEVYDDRACSECSKKKTTLDAAKDDQLLMRKLIQALENANEKKDQCSMVDNLFAKRPPSSPPFRKAAHCMTNYCQDPCETVKVNPCCYTGCDPVDDSCSDPCCPQPCCPSVCKPVYKTICKTICKPVCKPCCPKPCCKPVCPKPCPKPCPPICKPKPCCSDPCPVSPDCEDCCESEQWMCPPGGKCNKPSKPCCPQSQGNQVVSDFALSPSWNDQQYGLVDSESAPTTRSRSNANSGQHKQPFSSNYENDSVLYAETQSSESNPNPKLSLSNMGNSDDNLSSLVPLNSTVRLHHGNRQQSRPSKLPRSKPSKNHRSRSESSDIIEDYNQSCKDTNSNTNSNSNSNSNSTEADADACSTCGEPLTSSEMDNAYNIHMVGYNKNQPRRSRHPRRQIRRPIPPVFVGPLVPCPTGCGPCGPTQPSPCIQPCPPGTLCPNPNPCSPGIGPQPPAPCAPCGQPANLCANAPPLPIQPNPCPPTHSQNCEPCGQPCQPCGQPLHPNIFDLMSMPINVPNTGNNSNCLQPVQQLQQFQVEPMVVDVNTFSEYE